MSLSVTFRFRRIMQQAKPYKGGVVIVASMAIHFVTLWTLPRCLGAEKSGRPARASAGRSTASPIPRRISSGSPGLIDFFRRQFPGPPATEIGKNHELVRAAFQDVTAAANRATVRLFADGKLVALGAIVDSDGLILTKASEIDGHRITCRLRQGRELRARTVSTDTRHDLALIQVAARNLTPIQLSKERDLPAGSLLATPGGFGKRPLSIGVVSVAARSVPKLRGFLGVQVEPSDKGARVSVVLPDSGAARAGVKADDTILKLNGQSVTTPRDLDAMVHRHRSGDTVLLLIQRESTTVEVPVTLGRIVEMRRTGDEKRRGTSSGLSARRSDFPSVFQHDTILRPNECGGPVVDVEGKVAGINIARASRVASYAIPAQVVRSLIGSLKAGANAATD